MIKKAIGLKLLFSFGLSDTVLDKLAKGKKGIAFFKEWHNPVRHQFPRRQVIVYYIDEIVACDFIYFFIE